MLVLVYTETGEVLLLRRQWPANYWQSVTGSLEWHETAVQAAQRELVEETGLRAASGRLTDCAYTQRFPIVTPWKRRYAPGARYNTEYVFRFVVTKRRLIRLNRREHTDYRWLPWEKAARTVASWTNREAILRFVGSDQPCGFLGIEAANE